MKAMIATLSGETVASLTDQGPVGRDAQQPPEPEEPNGAWRTWLFLGGRGAGKTWAGARWVRRRVEHGAAVALVGPTLHDVREVMIEGPAGLRATAVAANRPIYESSRRRLVWPKTGGVAYAYSAEDPESLRGPQHHFAWADEFCAWREGRETLAQLRLGLRLGAAPQLAVTTTPKPTAALRALLGEPGLWLTRSATADNAHNLAPAFVEGLQALYGGTRLAAQELEGVVTEAEGALFRAEDLRRARGAPPATLERLILAADPSASAAGDACGLVIAGRAEGRAYVLADLTRPGLSPLGWARVAAEAAAAHGLDAVVAEANMGGEMVRSLLAQAGCPCPVRLVHARLSKARRAEPVAALYEQGRVVHCGAFPALEEELMALDARAPARRRGASPDRADALVWAVTHLLLDGAETPRLRVL